MKAFDWHRILLGVAPWSFLLEVALRVLTVYLVLVLTVRLLGKRMSGHIGNLELAVMLALGAIVAVPFQDPMRGVLPSLVLLTCLLALQRGLSALGARHAGIERALQNCPSLLVADGVLTLDGLRDANVSADQLFAVLRSQGVGQLGEIKRVYLEAYGCFSLFRQEPAQPGLSIAPSWDEALRGAQDKADGVVRARAAPDSGAPSCANCRTRHWVEAVKAR
jgi:uncharacterized membrane protein YcaP (DUF421 family)